LRRASRGHLRCIVTGGGIGSDEEVPQTSLKLPSPSKPTSYKVGYRKPPTASRFKPGQSGNPKGRPKGARNKLPAPNEEWLKAIIIEEAYRTVKVTEGNRQIAFPMVKAIVRSMAMNAARGQHRAQQKFTELLSETERANKAQMDELLNEAIKYKIHWEQELERCKRLGITAPEPLPHPDDIVIDMRTGQVIFKGPMTKEDKAEWDWLRKRLEAYDRQIAQHTLMLKDSKMKRHHRYIQEDIARCMRMRDKIASVIGEPRKDDLQ
jgi:Family of unknown function (DUF5681)